MLYCMFKVKNILDWYRIHLRQYKARISPQIYENTELSLDYGEKCKQIGYASNEGDLHIGKTFCVSDTLNFRNNWVSRLDTCVKYADTLLISSPERSCRGPWHFSWSCLAVKIMSFVPLSFLNPHWLSGRCPDCSRCSFIWLSRTLARTYPTTDNKEMPQWLNMIYLFFFFFLG